MGVSVNKFRLCKLEKYHGVLYWFDWTPYLQALSEWITMLITRGGVEVFGGDLLANQRVCRA